MIVSGGENVFPREVEDLLADHAEVEEVAVVGVADEEFGERLRAFVVPRADSGLTEATIKAHVKENLALAMGDRVVMETSGGGGYGLPERSKPS